MGKARGSDASMMVGFPAIYGAIEPICRKINFKTAGLGTSQARDKVEEAGQGRHPSPTTPGAIDGQNRNITAAIDLNEVYYFLRLLLGTPVVTNVLTDYTYTFENGKVLDHAFIEIQHPKIPRFQGNLGVKMESMAFNFQRQGTPEISMVVNQQGETLPVPIVTAVTSPLPDLPRLLAAAPHGAIKMNGAAIASLQSGGVTIGNGLELDPGIRSDGVNGGDKLVH